LSKGGVTKPSSNRRRRFRAPLHVKKKFMTAPLSPPLKAEHGVRSMAVRRDDTVTITKGDRKLTEGRVIRVDVSRGRLYVEGVTRQRLDGTTVQMPVRAENVMITRLSLDDELRRRILERKGFKREKGG